MAASLAGALATRGRRRREDGECIGGLCNDSSLADDVICAWSRGDSVITSVRATKQPFSSAGALTVGVSNMALFDRAESPRNGLAETSRRVRTVGRNGADKIPISQDLEGAVTEGAINSLHSCTLTSSALLL